MTSQWVFISTTKTSSHISLIVNKISELLQSIAKHCHPDLTKDETSHFSSHSGRVWAVVLLNEAGMNSDFIKSWLCWMGDFYRLYLRDTAVLQAKHVTALEKSSFFILSPCMEKLYYTRWYCSWWWQHGFLLVLSFLKKKGGKIPISKRGGGGNPNLQKA